MVGTQTPTDIGGRDIGQVEVSDNEVTAGGKVFLRDRFSATDDQKSQLAAKFFPSMPQVKFGEDVRPNEPGEAVVAESGAEGLDRIDGVARRRQLPFDVVYANPGVFRGDLFAHRQAVLERPQRRVLREGVTVDWKPPNLIDIHRFEEIDRKQNMADVWRIEGAA